MKKISSKFKSKPSYDLYVQLWYILKIYFIRINILIYFKYYNWNVSNIHIIKELNILKILYEYDYKVFKTLLFLYWDLENYLEGQDHVKNSLILDIENLNFSCIKFKNKIKMNVEFLDKIKIKKPINLWTNLEDLGMFKEILKYEIYSKIYRLDTTFKNENYISIYKLYKSYNDLFSEEEFAILLKFNKIIEESYYQQFLEKLYKEWNLELTIDLTKKYKMKIQDLDLELNKLLESIANEKKKNE